MRHEGDATIIITLSYSFVLCYTFIVASFLRRPTPSPSHGSPDFVEASWRVRVSFVGQDLQEFSPEAIRRNRLAVCHRPDCLFRLVP